MEKPRLIWQQQIRRLCDVFEGYHIILIYSNKPIPGKKKFIKRLENEGLAEYIDTSTHINRNKIMGRIITNEIPKAFIFDLPDFQPSKFWDLVKSIKDGYAVDNRWKFKARWFDCPQILIFTTTEPDLKEIDKYIHSQQLYCWTIDQNLALVDTNQSL